MLLTGCKRRIRTNTDELKLTCGVDIREHIDASGTGYAVDLLEALYTVFTLKELPPPAPLMDEDSYAPPNSATGEDDDTMR